LEQCFFFTHAPFQARQSSGRGSSIQVEGNGKLFLKNKQIVTNIFVSVQQQY